MIVDLNGKVAIVTGGGRGIGRATALQLADAGARVAICARTEGEVQSVATERSSIDSLAGDVSDAIFVQRLVDTVMQTHGRIDILVNNAAMLGRAPIAQLDPDLWDRVMEVNLRGAYLLSRAVFQQMSHQQPPGGSIVNMGSLSGVRGPEKFPGLAAYNVSKAGVIALSDILAVEGKPFDIRVNAVSPGAVETAMLREAGHGLKARATPDDVARTILFLVSDASRPMTGANIEILSNA
jgi:NAD(P)-dependent dehydrogenase (short-subunit alcohol dehydrogenase family)